MILAIVRTARIHVAVTFHGVNRKNGWWNIGGHWDIHQRALIEKLYLVMQRMVCSVAFCAACLLVC